jgi:hypothetical protein
MKKIVSVLLTAILFIIPMTSVQAYSPLPPDEQVAYLFQKFYSQRTDGGNTQNVKCLEISDYSESESSIEYYLIQFTSDDTENTNYFQRFGNSKEFYECNEVKNQLFPSGIAIFVGDPYDDEYADSFLSLPEISETNPLLIDSISKLIGTDFVGKFGDVNGDSKISIVDATDIQRHLVALELITDNRLALADVNGDGIINIDDVTLLQKYIAGYDVELG